jgi:hypothetical protein
MGTMLLVLMGTMLLLLLLLLLLLVQMGTHRPQIDHAA